MAWYLVKHSDNFTLTYMKYTGNHLGLMDSAKRIMHYKNMV
jgi:hypothetical protein